MEQVGRFGGVTLPQFEILFFLDQEPKGVRMHELADTIGISRSGLTYQIARLERHGWVERSSEAGNARAVIARLTDAGRERAASMQREHLSFVKERIFGRLSEEEIRLLLVVFRKIAEGADSTDG